MKLRWWIKVGDRVKVQTTTDKGYRVFPTGTTTDLHTLACEPSSRNSKVVSVQFDSDHKDAPKGGKGDYPSAFVTRI